MFKTVIKYEFNNDDYIHYIETDKKLSEDELEELGYLLASFPHANNKSWPELFKNLNIVNLSKKSCGLAANAYDSYGNTVLGVAAEKGEVALVQRLIDMGATVNIPDHKWKKLPLHWAINNAKSFLNKDCIEGAAVVQCLLDNGADPNLACYGYDKETPYQYAKERGFTAATKLIEEKLQKLNFRIT